MASNPGVKPPGPPYAPMVAMLGGSPTKLPDIPISAVFIALFLIGAVSNMIILRRNNSRGHKFLLSGVTFGFCMARTAANVLRIVWSTAPTNAGLAIAAGILANAGVLLLFIVNLVFFQRVLRAHHPGLGWSRGVSLLFKGLYMCVIACLIMVIVASVYGFYTLDRSVLLKIKDVRLFASVFLAVLAFIPLPGTILVVLTSGFQPVENFGLGSMRTKVILLIFTSTLLSLGASFRAGVAFLPVRPRTDPGWYNSKACFYCFNYALEVIVMYTYTFSRMDKRFWIPNGSHQPGDYSSGAAQVKNDSQSENLGAETEFKTEDSKQPV